MKPKFSALWPDAASELLLQAALESGHVALNAFIGWKNARGLAQYSDVDFAATRLLPTVYHNLTKQGLNDSWLPQMSGLHRYHWMRNARTQQYLQEIFHQLRESGGRCVVLGGIALLASGTLNDLGERPALAGEVLIAPEDAPRLREQLQSRRWRPTTKIPPVPGWRAEIWQGPDKAALLVHYRWLPKPFPVIGTARLLEYSQLVEWCGATFHVPDATDQLLHAIVCCRRMTSHHLAPNVWVADAHRILERSESQIDWDRLQREFESFRTRHAVCESLEYLRTRFGARVPEDWLTEARPPGSSEEEQRLLLRACRQPIGMSLTGTIEWLRQPWLDYVGAEKTANQPLSIKSFWRYWSWRASCELARHRPQFSQKQSAHRPHDPLDAKAA